jgi:Ca2+/H+ antiporter, TMEM165/GDT1 family
MLLNNTTLSDYIVLIKDCTVRCITPFHIRLLRACSTLTHQTRKGQGEAGHSELEEVEAELSTPKKGRLEKNGKANHLLSAILVEAFTMTFLAEWGDRSQITTIGLAASQNAVGVTLGGCVGHFLCTGAAVLGGKQLASVIDERTVNTVGAIMFIIFGALAWYEGP